MLHQYLTLLHDRLLADRTRKQVERFILVVAIVGFLVNLLLIYLANLGVITLGGGDSALLRSPIAAIYTPFSFILIYEVYLLIYYLPRSITTYISKQYEIITLIIIRRLFKDLASLDLASNWFESKYDLQFTYDLVASVVLFYLLYLFNVHNPNKFVPNKEVPAHTARFVGFKKMLAVCLVPVLVLLAGYSLLSWLLGALQVMDADGVAFKNINNVFFDEFFTLLIVVDVILLLLSFFHTDEFHKVIRNSGFVISTILLRLSFSVEGLVNTLLIVAAIVFGLLILVIHNQYEKKATRPLAP